MCQTSFYDRHIVPRLVHAGCSADEFSAARERIIPRAAGVVVEIGFGSGLNLPHYDPRKVELLIGIEPDATMFELAKDALARTPLAAELHQGSAEALPLKDASADTVVVTYALCTIPRPDEALKEIRRVLKADGKLLFCEHASAAGWRGALQRRLNGGWGGLFGGCNLTRDPIATIKAAGFVLDEVAAKPFPLSLAVLGTHYCGQAHIRAAEMRHELPRWRRREAAMAPAG